MVGLFTPQRWSNNAKQSFLFGNPVVKYLLAEHPPPLKFKLTSICDAFIRFKIILHICSPHLSIILHELLEGRDFIFLPLYHLERPRALELEGINEHLVDR